RAEHLSDERRCWVGAVPLGHVRASFGLDHAHVRLPELAQDQLALDEVACESIGLLHQDHAHTPFVSTRPNNSDSPGLPTSGSVPETHSSRHSATSCILAALA